MQENEEQIKTDQCVVLFVCIPPVLLLKTFQSPIKDTLFSVKTDTTQIKERKDSKINVHTRSESIGFIL